MADISKLKDLLTPEQYTAVDEALKEAKLNLADLSGGGYVAKEKFDKESEKAKQLETQVKDANTQIEEFKKLDVEGVKKAADEWKIKAETAEADYKAKLYERDLGDALKSRLTQDKVKDHVGLKAHLKMDLLKLDGENLIGYDEQIKSLKENKELAFYFDSGESDDPTFTKQQTGGGSTGQTDSLRAAMGLK